MHGLPSCLSGAAVTGTGRLEQVSVEENPLKAVHRSWVNMLGKQRSLYTVLQKYARIGLKQNLLRSTTLDIITRQLDNIPLCLYSRGGKIF